MRYLGTAAPPAAPGSRQDAPVARILVGGGRGDGRPARGRHAGRGAAGSSSPAAPTAARRSCCAPASGRPRDLQALGIDGRRGPAGRRREPRRPSGGRTSTRAGAARRQAGPILHSIATLPELDHAAGRRAARSHVLDLPIPTAPISGFWLDPNLLKPRVEGVGPTTFGRIPPDRPADHAPRLRPGTATSTGWSRPIGSGGRAREPARDPADSSTARRRPGAATRRGAAPTRGRRRAYSIPHVVGTCAMGPSPEDGAVVGRARSRPRRPAAERRRCVDHPGCPVGLPAPHHDHAGRAPRRSLPALL